MKELVFASNERKPLNSQAILHKIEELGYRYIPQKPSIGTLLYYDTQNGAFFSKGYRLWKSSETSPLILEADNKRRPDRVEAISKGRPLVPLLKTKVQREPFRVEAPASRGWELIFETWTFWDPYKEKDKKKKRILRLKTKSKVDKKYLADLLASHIPVKTIDFDILHTGLSELELPMPGAPIIPAYRLLPQDSFSDAGIKIIGLQVYRMRANIEGTIRDLDPEFLHDLRVATRRARFVLKIFGEIWEPDEIQNLRRELKWIAQSVSDVRDLDVLLARLEVDLNKAGASQETRGKVYAILDKQRAVALNGLRSALRSDRYSSLISRLRRLGSRERSANNDLTKLAHTRAFFFIQKALSKIRKYRKLKAKKLEDVDLHRLRIDFKRLRYTCEFFATYYTREMARIIKDLIRFQDCLGNHQDACMAMENIKALLSETSEEPSITLALGALVQVQRQRADRTRKEFTRIWNDFKSINKRLRRELSAVKEGSK